MSLDQLSDLTNVGSLTAFAVVCITVMYLRVTHPELIRPFRTPMFPVVPILGALMCLFLLMSLMAGAATRNFFLTYLAVGIAIYFLYGMSHSKLGKGILVVGHEPQPMELPHSED
jgi:APA family basic amino acid/polyamine antiporter